MGRNLLGKLLLVDEEKQRRISAADDRVRKEQVLLHVCQSVRKEEDIVGDLVFTSSHKEWPDFQSMKGF